MKTAETTPTYSPHHPLIQIRREQEEMKAKAKHDVKTLMEDGRFSNFREGNEYRCVKRQDGRMVLMDEQKCGFICTMEEFEEDFELLESEQQ